MQLLTENGLSVGDGQSALYSSYGQKDHDLIFFTKQINYWFRLDAIANM